MSSSGSMKIGMRSSTAARLAARRRSCGWPRVASRLSSTMASFSMHSGWRCTRKAARRRCSRALAGGGAGVRRGAPLIEGFGEVHQEPPM
jgi:hypothetical protein